MKIILTLTTTLLATAGLYAADERRDDNPANINLDEFQLQYAPEQYDSLLSYWYEKNVVSSFDVFFHDFIDLDSTANYTSDIPDSVYQNRLKMLVSPIHLPYNDIVKRHIIAYTTVRKETMRRILGLSQYYFPMIEQELERNGMPLELRMLPVIESALNPTAVSRAGATGLWQFMYGTGKHYGLEVTSFVDMRRDPEAATKAACQYLAYLHSMYSDWTLALAAYNCGPGNVNKALKRAGPEAKTYWDIYPHLPRETRGYVPAFIAATYAYTFHKQHNMDPYDPPMPLATDTINVTRLMHLEQVASTLGTPIETLRALNPQYKMDIIPALDKVYTITLPVSDISRYLEHEQTILGKDTIYLAQYLKSGDPVKIAQQIAAASVPKSTVYRVKKGDTLGAIARRYNTSVSKLMKNNNIKSANKLRVGQTIRIR